MPEPHPEKKRTVWRHRLRGSEHVLVSVVTRHGKPFVEVVVNAALPPVEADSSGPPHVQDSRD